jgi:hypothetical protein
MWRSTVVFPHFPVQNRRQLSALRQLVIFSSSGEIGFRSSAWSCPASTFCHHHHCSAHPEPPARIQCFSQGLPRNSSTRQHTQPTGNAAHDWGTGFLLTASVTPILLMA